MGLFVKYQDLLFLDLQIENNRSLDEYVFDHPSMARRALKNIALGMLLEITWVSLLWLNIKYLILFNYDLK